MTLLIIEPDARLQCAEHQQHKHTYSWNLITSPAHTEHLASTLSAPLEVVYNNIQQTHQVTLRVGGAVRYKSARERIGCRINFIPNALDICERRLAHFIELAESFV